MPGRRRGIRPVPPADGLKPRPTVDLARALVDAVGREYPHALQQELHADADVQPPRRVNPSFFGSYDWHSAVHCHWTLVRCLGLGPPDDVARAATAALDDHLEPSRLAGELAFFRGPGGRTSARPYGWAWLLLLEAECRRAAGRDLSRAAVWAEALGPLADHLRGEMLGYLESTLAFPIRAGTHRNTAFSLQLTGRAAAAVGDTGLSQRVGGVARRMFGHPEAWSWDEPPSGDAFLSPPLVTADLMIDVLDPDELEVWVDRAGPVGPAPWPVPAFAPDGPDPGTVHLEGLLMSRAWALDAVGRALPPGSAAADAALEARDAHLLAVDRIDPIDGFNRSHWLPTYLVYLDARLDDTV